MRSSRRLSLTDEAEGDFRSILVHSQEAWGKEHRDLYAERVTAAMNELLDYSLLGGTRDEILPGLRCRPVGRHMIYYFVDERTVAIVRILHARMDASRHLNPPKP